MILEQKNPKHDSCIIPLEPRIETLLNMTNEVMIKIRNHVGVETK